MKYFVTGGRCDNMDLNSVVLDSRVEFGPFLTYQEAYDCWKEHSWRNVDDALYRLKIIPPEWVPSMRPWDIISDMCSTEVIREVERATQWSPFGWHDHD